MISWKIFSEKVIDDFKNNKGCNFNHIKKMNIITITNKVDRSYDFYLKHIIHASEWKLYAMINKITKLTNKFNCIWRHLLNRKFESFLV